MFQARAYELSNPRLRRLASALGPPYVRVSGTWANSAFFSDHVIDDFPNWCFAPRGAARRPLGRERSKIGLPRSIAAKRWRTQLKTSLQKRDTYPGETSFHSSLARVASSLNRW